MFAQGDPTPPPQEGQGYEVLAAIPGVTDGDIPADLGSYVNLVYRASIAIGAVLAVLMLVIGGLQYMGTDVFSKKNQGRDRIRHALMGLGLLLVSYLILSTINEDLLNLDLNIKDADTGGLLIGTLYEQELQQNLATYGSRGHATQDSIETHTQNEQDGYKRANAKYCSAVSLFPVPEEERQAQKDRIMRRCVINFENAKRQR